MAVPPSRVSGTGYQSVTGLLQCRARWTWLKLNLTEVGQSTQNFPGTLDAFRLQAVHLGADTSSASPARLGGGYLLTP